MSKERNILRFVPQKLRKSFANGNPSSDVEENVKQKLYDLDLVHIIMTLETQSSQDPQDMQKLHLLSMETPKIWRSQMKL